MGQFGPWDCVVWVGSTHVNFGTERIQSTQNGNCILQKVSTVGASFRLRCPLRYCLLFGMVTAAPDDGDTFLSWRECRWCHCSAYDAAATVVSITAATLAADATLPLLPHPSAPPSPASDAADASSTKTLQTAASKHRLIVPASSLSLFSSKYFVRSHRTLLQILNHPKHERRLV